MSETIFDTLYEAVQRFIAEFELERRCSQAVIYLQKESLEDIYHGMSIVHLHAMTGLHVYKDKVKATADGQDTWSFVSTYKMPLEAIRVIPKDLFNRDADPKDKVDHDVVQRQDQDTIIYLQWRAYILDLIKFIRHPITVEGIDPTDGEEDRPKKSSKSSHRAASPSARSIPRNRRQRRDMQKRYGNTAAEEAAARESPPLMRDMFGNMGTIRYNPAKPSGPPVATPSAQAVAPAPAPSSTASK